MDKISKMNTKMPTNRLKMIQIRMRMLKIQKMSKIKQMKTVKVRMRLKEMMRNKSKMTKKKHRND